MRMNSLKSRAMNCGPLSEMIRGVTPGNFSRARWMIWRRSSGKMPSGYYPGTKEAHEAVAVYWFSENRNFAFEGVATV